MRQIYIRTLCKALRNSVGIMALTFALGTCVLRLLGKNKGLAWGDILGYALVLVLLINIVNITSYSLPSQMFVAPLSKGQRENYVKGIFAGRMLVSAVISLIGVSVMIICDPHMLFCGILIFLNLMAGTYEIGFREYFEERHVGAMVGVVFCSIANISVMAGVLGGNGSPIQADPVTTGMLTALVIINAVAVVLFSRHFKEMVQTYASYEKSRAIAAVRRACKNMRR